MTSVCTALSAGLRSGFGWTACTDFIATWKLFKRMTSFEDQHCMVALDQEPGSMPTCAKGYGGEVALKSCGAVTALAVSGLHSDAWRNTLFCLFTSQDQGTISVPRTLFSGTFSSTWVKNTQHNRIYVTHTIADWPCWSCDLNVSVIRFSNIKTVYKKRCYTEVQSLMRWRKSVVMLRLWVKHQIVRSLLVHLHISMEVVLSQNPQQTANPQLPSHQHPVWSFGWSRMCLNSLYSCSGRTHCFGTCCQFVAKLSHIPTIKWISGLAASVL